MKTFNSVSSPQLLTRTRALVQEERRITAELLHLLRELENRRLYAELGYSSLFEFCRRDLGYSESAAYRRISAMRLLRDLPEVEEKIKDGTITLSHACSLQTFFNAEKKNQREYTPTEKRELLQKVEQTSHRDAERTLAAISPSATLPDRSRAIDESRTEIRFVANTELMQKLERARELLSHRGVDTYAELFEKLTDEFLKRTDPLKKSAPLRTASPTPEVTSASERRAIPAATRRQVWQRDQGKCKFRSPQGRSCGSRWQVQIDHIRPVARGGGNDPSNLRLLCAQHNRLAAIHELGTQVMNKYLGAG